MTERGNLKSRAYKQQIVAFHNMRFGKITPTDIDVFMDFGNELFIFGEAKYGSADLPLGQRLALERLCDASNCPPARWACAFILHHKERGDIDIANTAVHTYRWQGRWLVPSVEGMTFRQGVESIRDWVKRKHDYKVA